MTKKKIFLIILFLSMFFVPQLSFGTDLTVPFGNTTSIDGPGDYIRTLYIFGLGFGTLLAMLMLVIGAIQYTISEAVTSKEDAKDRMLKAVWGLILLLVATLILNFINPELPELNEPTIQPLPVIQSTDPESQPFDPNQFNNLPY